MMLKSWMVFYNRDTDKLVAYEDKHDGYVMCKPDNLTLLGFPLAKSEADAIHYVTQILTEKVLKDLKYSIKPYPKD
jgi:hypothetical protein